MSSKITDEIGRIAAENAGRLTPDLVVEAAKDPDNPLHEYFANRGCWNAGEAQARWCLTVARSLIRTVYVTVKTTRIDFTAPVYVRDPTAAARTRGYVSIATLRTDADAARDALVREFKNAAAAMVRAKAIAAVLNMTGEVERIRAEIELVLRETEHDSGGIHLS